MRALAGALALLALGACSQSSEAPLPDPEDMIDCALAGAAEFARTCVVERSTESEALFLTVRHPDGVFRRFEVVADGRGIVTADGAEPAEISVEESHIVVAVSADRYRLPATIADSAADE